MAQNYNRSYKVVFGRPEHDAPAYLQEGQGIIKLSPVNVEVDALTIPAGDIVSMSNLVSEGSKRRGFNFQLKSTRSSGSSGSKAEHSTLILYNLNEESLAVLNQEGCVVRVYAGYGGNIDLVYSGDIKSIFPKTQGNDIIYECLCTDGLIDIKNTKVSLQYDESVSMKDVVTDLAGRFPSGSVGTVAAKKLESTYVTGGYVCQGKLINIFNKLCSQNSLTYSRFNGKITVKPEQLVQGTEDYEELTKNTYTLSSSNIKTLDPIIDNATKFTKQTDTKRGVVVTTYLIPITLDQFFTIPPEANQSYAGTYKITAININLDSRKGPWDVTLKGEPM
jgi:hypothetical protein